MKRSLCAIAILALAGQIAPALSEPSDTEQIAAEPEPIKTAERSDPDTGTAEARNTEPSLPGATGNLRKRAISDAFRDFQPSEEISADNAVTFPVDI